MSADKGGQAPRPFDVRTVRYLIKLMSRHDLSEIDLHEGEQRIRLRRGAPPAPTAPFALSLPAVSVAAPNPAAHAPGPVAAPAAAARPEKPYHFIKSETPGTFYARPKPEAEPYVTVGAQVVKGKTVVCLIEAMKLFNEILADCDGTVTEVCVQDGQAVEYGTVLFKIDPA